MTILQHVQKAEQRRRARIQAQYSNLKAYRGVPYEHVTNGKPDPEPYLLAAAKICVDPARVAVIEDSHTGMSAALAAGMSAFMMPHYHGAADGRWQPVSAFPLPGQPLRTVA